MLRKQLSKTPEETRKTTERENTDDLEVQDESPLRRTLGIICAMSSCIFFAFSSLLVKLLREIPPPEVVFFRNMVQVIFVLPPLIYNKIPIVGNTRHLPFLCVRGTAGTLALCCQFYAFQHMALADTYIHTYIRLLTTSPKGLFSANYKEKDKNKNIYKLFKVTIANH